MTIKYAILGLLSWKPLSGYDLKKIFADSSIYYWSGNNNQIYKTLVQLHNEGLVTQEIQPQESLPARKVYTITDKGRVELKSWLFSSPELPELHNTFLIQLAWADQLSASELEALLDRYEQEVQVQALMQREKARRGANTPARSGRERLLWKSIMENIISFYEHELDWVHRLRIELTERQGTA